MFTHDKLRITQLEILFMNELDKKRLLSLSDELGKSYPSMQRYFKENSFPAEVCIKAELLTDGELVASQLRPDIFQPTKDHKLLADSCVKYFDYHLDNGCEEIIISVLNYLEHQQPKLYDSTLARIKSECKAGGQFINRRLAHQSYGFNNTPRKDTN